MTYSSIQTFFIKLIYFFYKLLYTPKQQTKQQTMEDIKEEIMEDTKEEIKEEPNINIGSLNSIIEKCEYVKNCVSNKTKELHSLSYLVDRDLSQSDCIKLGTGIEIVLRDVITSYSKLQNIRPKNAKGEKEKDHLFKDETNKIIHYAECKSNLNLDTEKSKSTFEKCIKISQQLKEENPEYEIKMYLVGARYITNKDIPKNIIKKYELIKENVLGINEYFIMLGIRFQFTDENEYKMYINTLANSMFSNSL